jgi:hypothetical protein
MHGSDKAGSTAAIHLHIGYRRLNPTYPDIKSAHTHGPYHAWTAQRVGVASTSWVKLGALQAPSLNTTCMAPRGSQSMDQIKYALPLAPGF